MDLDNMKAAWDELNEKLVNQQLLNERLLKQISSEQSANRFSKILHAEIIGQCLNWGITLFFVFRFGLLDSLFLQIGVVVLVLQALLATYFSYLLYRKMEAIDINKNTVIEAIRAMAAFKGYYYWHKKVAVLLAYVSLFFVVPLLVKVVHNKDVLDSLDIFGWPIVLGVSLGTILVVVINRHIYDKNINEVEDLLESLNTL